MADSSLPIAIFLGAGRPSRGTRPSALQQTPGDSRRTLDWLIGAFAGRVDALHYVGGYQIESVAAEYPDLHYSINVDWRTTGSLGSLFVAALDKGRAHYVSYSDVLYSAQVIDRLEERPEDVVVAVDRTWRHRYEARSQKDISLAEILALSGDVPVAVADGREDAEGGAEFVGLMRLSPRAIERVIELRQGAPELARHGLPWLLLELKNSGLSVHAVDVQNHWAELNAPQDISRFVFGTKGHTLARLAPVVRNSRIGDQVRFTVGQWRSSPASCLASVKETFGNARLAVRSSALGEDSFTETLAGAFLSVLGVGAGESEQSDAIERVIASYSDDNAGHEVLIQEMIEEVCVSGVAFTRTLSHGAPYYQINFDDVTSSTESVTSGTGRDLKTIFVHRDSSELPAGTSSSLAALLPALTEVERLAGHDSLDVEFAIDASGVVHLLQLRPMTVDCDEWLIDDSTVRATLDQAERLFRDKQAPAPFASGSRTIFGVMTDWNPAEMIGVKPRQLASSLYRYLITDDTWAIQRAEYGYRDVRPLALLVTFAGHPYIDIRASLASFVPAGVPDALAERLVDFYLDTLTKSPELHDKVEFDVAVTCKAFDFERQGRRLLDAGFTQEELGTLEQALHEISRHALERGTSDLAAIETLQKRYERIISVGASPLERALTLLEDCRRYGVLPFSHLARSAFVAMTFLRSLVDEEAITQEELDEFLRSLGTVAGDFRRHAEAAATGELTFEEFTALYGHLRPGTYDITSMTYAADPERYLRPLVAAADGRQGEPVTEFAWSSASRERIAGHLRAVSLPDDVDAFDAFLRGAIEGREFGKFAFTRNISAALEALAEFGDQHGLTREELAHVGIQDFNALRLAPPAADAAVWLRGRSEEGAESYRVTQSIELPPLLMHSSDFYSFRYPDSEPNFIGADCATGEVLVLEKEALAGTELPGKIVLIPSADPGFDWLFGQDLGGLITMYGGANSHMAIRSAELGLPAAIGVGEGLYEQIRRAKLLELDCGHRCIRVVA